MPNSSDERVTVMKEAVASDIDRKVRFVYGRTPLGGCDYARPVGIAGDTVELRTENFGDKAFVSFDEYTEMRKQPMVKVGIFQFVPESDAAARSILFANQYPESADRALARYESAFARHNLTPEKLDAVMRVVEKAREYRRVKANPDMSIPPNERSTQHAEAWGALDQALTALDGDTP